MAILASRDRPTVCLNRAPETVVAAATETRRRDQTKGIAAWKPYKSMNIPITRTRRSNDTPGSAFAGPSESR
jgi:hypothetical protein